MEMECHVTGPRIGTPHVASLKRGSVGWCRSRSRLLAGRRGELDVVAGPAGPPAFDQFGLEQADRGCGESIIPAGPAPVRSTAGVQDRSAAPRSYTPGRAEGMGRGHSGLASAT